MPEINISSTSLLISATLPCFICLIGVPLGFFLLWRTQMNAPIYALSLQVRLQIFVWTLATSQILIMTLYMFYFWFTPDDSETLYTTMHKSQFELILERVKSPELNINKPLVFMLNGMYMLTTHACTLSVTFIMIDRCFALMYPIYYTDRTKLILLRTCLGCIITWTICIFVNMCIVDWPLFVKAKCFNVYCSLPKTISVMLYFKITMTVLNFFLAILFCWLLWRRNSNKIVLQNSSQYFAQRANFIAMWSVFSEFTFNILPIFTLGISVFFHINTNLPIYGQFIMTGVALDGLCTIILYIKIIIFKRHRVFVNTISDFAVKFHHGFGINGKQLDPTSTSNKSQQVV